MPIESVKYFVIIPATFVGIYSVKVDFVDTDIGFVMRRKNVAPISVDDESEIVYNNVIASEKLKFYVVLAG